MENTQELKDRNILIKAAENPRGAPAFKDLVNDPPSSEEEFRALWKLYFLSLTGSVLREQNIANDSSHMLIAALEAADLLPAGNNLSRYIRVVLDYVRGLMKFESLEAEVKLDPVTQTPIGFGGKISLREPSAEQKRAGLSSIDELFEVANRALEDGGLEIWLVLDRLDVAFAETAELEENALRALFKVYLDLLAYERISPKVFLRSDIWKRITSKGFREASHITKTATISWDKQSLMNLIVRRIMKNESIRQFYGVESNEILNSSDKQEEIFYRIFPPKVDPGERRPVTFDWMLSRITDGLSQTAPRELIHLLSSVRAVQLQKLENGSGDPPDQLLIDGAAIKDALKQVSKVRLEQTILAEYPQYRDDLLRLEGKKTQQSPSTLSEVWECSNTESIKKAMQLVDIGFFESRGTREDPEFWVPFLYRDSLEMVQGAELS